jgi:hypothetical protein
MRYLLFVSPRRRGIPLRLAGTHRPVRRELTPTEIDVRLRRGHHPQRVDGACVDLRHGVNEDEASENPEKVVTMSRLTYVTSLTNKRSRSYNGNLSILQKT